MLLSVFPENVFSMNSETLDSFISFSSAWESQDQLRIKKWKKSHFILTLAIDYFASC
jgi:hypothetical protein